MKMKHCGIALGVAMVMPVAAQAQWAQANVPNLTGQVGAGRAQVVVPFGCIAPATDSSAGLYVFCGTHGTSVAGASSGTASTVNEPTLDAIINSLGTAGSKGLQVQDSATGGQLALHSDIAALAKDATLTAGGMRVGLYPGTIGTTAGSPLYITPGTSAAFPITAASLPLPSGAATSANQATPTAPGTSSTTQAEPIQGVTGGIAVSTTDTNDGAGGTGISPPSGGSGFLGFQSGIYSVLGTILTTLQGTLTTAIKQGNALVSAANPLFVQQAGRTLTQGANTANRLAVPYTSGLTVIGYLAATPGAPRPISFLNMCSSAVQLVIDDGTGAAGTAPNTAASVASMLFSPGGQTTPVQGSAYNEVTTGRVQAYGLANCVIDLH